MLQVWWLYWLSWHSKYGGCNICLWYSTKYIDLRYKTSIPSVHVHGLYGTMTTQTLNHTFRL